MFPYVNADNGLVFGRKQCPLIVGGSECQFAVAVKYQPGIAGTEYGQSRGGKQIPEVFKTAKLPFNQISQASGRGPVIIFFQGGKVENMIVGSAFI